jgi:hypothetical protein
VLAHISGLPIEELVVVALPIGTALLHRAGMLWRRRREPPSLSSRAA